MKTLKTPPLVFIARTFTGSDSNKETFLLEIIYITKTKKNTLRGGQILGETKEKPIICMCIVKNQRQTMLISEY